MEESFPLDEELLSLVEPLPLEDSDEELELSDDELSDDEVSDDEVDVEDPELRVSVL